MWGFTSRIEIWNGLFDYGYGKPVFFSCSSFKDKLTTNNSQNRWTDSGDQQIHWWLSAFFLFLGKEWAGSSGREERQIHRRVENVDIVAEGMCGQRAPCVWYEAQNRWLKGFFLLSDLTHQLFSLFKLHSSDAWPPKIFHCLSLGRHPELITRNLREIIGYYGYREQPDLWQRLWVVHHLVLPIKTHLRICSLLFLARAADWKVPKCGYPDPSLLLEIYWWRLTSANKSEWEKKKKKNNRPNPCQNVRRAGDPLPFLTRWDWIWSRKRTIFHLLSSKGSKTGKRSPTTDKKEKIPCSFPHSRPIKRDIQNNGDQGQPGSSRSISDEKRKARKEKEKRAGNCMDLNFESDSQLLGEVTATR